MLAKSYILTGQKNFDRVLKEGKMFQSQNFGVAIYNRKDDKDSRFGFIISTKISRLATQRNRIKRAVSECIRFIMKDIKRGYDVVFLAKVSVASKITDEIMKEVKSFLASSIIAK